MSGFATLLLVLIVALVIVAIRHNGAPRRAAQQALAESERALSNRYKDIVLLLPAGALAGVRLSEDELLEYEDVFFRYFLLTNEQLIRRRDGMISHATWEKWAVSITATIQLPAFRQAWGQIIPGQGGRFFELQVLEARGSGYDPYVRNLAPF